MTRNSDSEVRTSFLDSDRTYGARRVWHDVLAAGFPCGLHRIERLMRARGPESPAATAAVAADCGERPSG